MYLSGIWRTLLSARGQLLFNTIKTGGYTSLVVHDVHYLFAKVPSFTQDDIIATAAHKHVVQGRNVWYGTLWSFGVSKATFLLSFCSTVQILTTGRVELEKV